VSDKFVPFQVLSESVIGHAFHSFANTAGSLVSLPGFGIGTMYKLCQVAVKFPVNHMSLRVFKRVCMASEVRCFEHLMIMDVIRANCRITELEEHPVVHLLRKGRCMFPCSLN